VWGGFLKVKKESMCAPMHPPNRLLDLICMQEGFSKLQAEDVQLCVCCLALFLFFKIEF